MNLPPDDFIDDDFMEGEFIDDEITTRWSNYKINLPTHDE